MKTYEDIFQQLVHAAYQGKLNDAFSRIHIYSQILRLDQTLITLAVDVHL